MYVLEWSVNESRGIPGATRAMHAYAPLILV